MRRTAALVAATAGMMLTGAASPARLPAGFMGAWAEDAAACRAYGGNDRFVVSATGWSQGEGDGRFVSVRQVAPASYRVGSLLNGESDGKPGLWTLLDNGARLRIAPADGLTPPFTYVRCARTAR